MTTIVTLCLVVIAICLALPLAIRLIVFLCTFSWLSLVLVYQILIAGYDHLRYFIRRIVKY